MFFNKAKIFKIYFHFIGYRCKNCQIAKRNNKLGLAKMGNNISKNVFIFDEIAHLYKKDFFPVVNFV